MKIMIASDIHGSAHFCELMLKRFEEEKAESLLLLGDVLYHGPRNDLPKEYNPKAVIEMLNAIKEKIFCVRGNCDTEVDQMVLQFPIMAEYAIIYSENGLIYSTHGHKYGETTPPPAEKGFVLLNGHTHVPKCVEYENYTYLNPGSVSIPKENSKHSYIVFDGAEFVWKDVENGEEYMRYKFKKE